MIPDNISTPCFILYEGEMKDSITGFKHALSSHFEKSVVGYSVKTNSLPYCLKIAKEQGCYAEVVSYHEYQLALKCGFEKEHIIYNGPLKSKETFLDAIGNGAIVNIECNREIDWLDELPKDKNYKVGIRLNIDISQISPLDENHEDDNSRFGFSAENGSFEQAIGRINNMPHVQLVGIHTHRTSRTRSLDFYKHVIQYTEKVIERYDMQLEYWDLGGGYFGMMPNKPTYEDYAKVFYNSLSEKNRKLTIIVEPGNALIASAFDYVSTVIDVKHHNGVYYITTDGTRNDIDPFFHKSNYFKSFLFNNKAGKIVEEAQVICGSTCLEYDRLFTIEGGNQLLQVGDQIIYNRVGAYTMCLTPLFIHYFPTVYLRNQQGELKVIREEWTENEFVNKSIY